MLKMLSVGQAALFLGVCIKTMHRWEESGELSPDWRTPGGHRRYELSSLTCWVEDSSKEQRGTALYARVSSHDQKEDLSRQQELLRSAAKAKGFVEKVPASVRISLGPVVKTLSIPARNAKEGRSKGGWAEYRKCLRETLLKEVRLQSKADRLRFKNRQHCSP